jgi:hypothetical protein
VVALSTLSWLKAVLSGHLLLAVCTSWNWRNDQVLVSNSDYGISNAFAALWLSTILKTLGKYCLMDLLIGEQTVWVLHYKHVICGQMSISVL